MAKARKLSVNKLVEEMATIALAAFDAEMHFRALAAKGNPERALPLLDKLDRLARGERPGTDASLRSE